MYCRVFLSCYLTCFKFATFRDYTRGVIVIKMEAHAWTLLWIFVDSSASLTIYKHNYSIKNIYHISLKTPRYCHNPKQQHDSLNICNLWHLLFEIYQLGLTSKTQSNIKFLFITMYVFVGILGPIWYEPWSTPSNNEWSQRIKLGNCQMLYALGVIAWHGSKTLTIWIVALLLFIVSITKESDSV